MINYLQTNILDMLEYIGEDNCQAILSSFVCPLNSDVEQFIHTKAIEFAKQKIAITYLVFAEDDGQQIFIGYYTLANKFVCVNSLSLSDSGFIPFDERTLSSTSTNNNEEVLVQMLKYFNH